MTSVAIYDMARNSFMYHESSLSPDYLIVKSGYKCTPTYIMLLKKVIGGILFGFMGHLTVKRGRHPIIILGFVLR